MPYTAPRKQWNDQDPLLIGTTYRRRVYFRYRDGTAYDLSGVTGTCEIRTEPDHSTGTLLASPTVSLITDGSDGGVQWLLDEAGTAGLSPNPRAYFGLVLSIDGDTREVLWGPLEIRRGVVDP